MIFGSPNLFSIQIDIVPAWSGSSKEGLFSVCINWKTIGKPQANPVTLAAATGQMHTLVNRLQTWPIALSGELSLTTLSEQVVFNRLINLTYPENAEEGSDNNWDYVFSPHCLSDSKIHLFAYQKGEFDVLLGGEARALSISTVVLPSGYVKDIVQQAHLYALNL